jgi:hypothetical protein
MHSHSPPNPLSQYALYLIEGSLYGRVGCIPLRVFEAERAVFNCYTRVEGEVRKGGEEGR